MPNSATLAPQILRPWPDQHHLPGGWPVLALLTLPISLLYLGYYAIRGLVDSLRGRNRLRFTSTVVIKAPLHDAGGLQRLIAPFSMARRLSRPSKSLCRTVSIFSSRAFPSIARNAAVSSFANTMAKGGFAAFEPFLTLCRCSRSMRMAP